MFEKKFIRCYRCGEYVMENTYECPNCGAHLKNNYSIGRIIFIVVCLVLGISFFVSGIITLLGIDFSPDKYENKHINENYNKDTTISMTEFNKIKTGMTYYEVVEIIGVNGELMSEVDIGEPEYATKIYTWEGNGYIGSNANVTFQGGKVISKAQIGLE